MIQAPSTRLTHHSLTLAQLIRALCIFITVLATSFASAQTATLSTMPSGETVQASPAKATNHADIIALLGYIGGKDTPKIMSQSLLQQLQKLFPQEPQSTWDDVNALLADEQRILQNQTIAIFVDEFTPDEISAMLTFYQSAAGQKMLQSLPNVTRRTRQVNQLWSKSVVADIEKMLAQKRAANNTSATPKNNETD